jgi:hypothetical protein
MTLAPTPLIRALLCAASMLMAARPWRPTLSRWTSTPDILAEIARQRARASTMARAAANAGKDGQGGRAAVGRGVRRGGHRQHRRQTARTGFSPIDVKRRQSSVT